MQLAEQVQGQIEADKKALMVSNSLHNDLFNVLSLYYLVNDLIFPEGFFKKNPLDSESIKSLKDLFPDEQSLNYFLKRHQPAPIEFQNHLIEKKVILGVFWRSYLVEELRTAAPNKDSVFFKSEDSNLVTFMGLISKFRQAKKGSSEDLNDFKQRYAAFYELYGDYFEKLSPEKTENEEVEFYKDWIQFGRMAHLKIFLTGGAIDLPLFCEFIDKVLGIQFELEIPNEGLQCNWEVLNDQIPPLRFSVNTNDGYCSLLQTEENELLDEYYAQLCFYGNEQIKINEGFIDASETLPFIRFDLLPTSTLDDLCAEIAQMRNSNNEEISFKQQKFKEELDRLISNLALLEIKEGEYNESIKNIEKDKSFISPREG